MVSRDINFSQVDMVNIIGVRFKRVKIFIEGVKEFIFAGTSILRNMTFPYKQTIIVRMIWLWRMTDMKAIIFFICKTNMFSLPLWRNTFIIYLLMWCFCKNIWSYTLINFLSLAIDLSEFSKYTIVLNVRSTQKRMEWST